MFCCLLSRITFFFFFKDYLNTVLQRQCQHTTLRLVFGMSKLVHEYHTKSHWGLNLLPKKIDLWLEDFKWFSCCTFLHAYR